MTLAQAAYSSFRPKKKKKTKKIQRMVSARMKVCVSSKGAQSRGFSPEAEREENYLKNEETTCVT